MLQRVRGALVALLALTPMLTLSVSAQDGFKTVEDGVPIGEQLPAGPFIVGSYAFFLLLMVFYLFTIWRRIGKVEAEMQALARRQGESSKR